nr:uridylate kinase [Clostridia bacterium]
MELAHLRAQNADVVECVDNDETAAVIAGLVSARMLVILTSTDGIYRDPSDPKTLVRTLYAKDPGQLESEIRALQRCCHGASRSGANGAFAKLEYIIKPAMQGTTVLIG